MTNFDAALKTLNEEQRQAVESIEGPVFVLAGPGTGKTQVLTLRIANILNKSDVSPDSILAITFTEAGVYSMRKRLSQFIGKDSLKVGIFTFHSFCTDLLKSRRDIFYDISDYEPITDIDKNQIIKCIIDQNNFTEIKPFNSIYYYVNECISKISSLKRESITINEYINLLNSNNHGLDEKKLAQNFELLEVYKQYQEQLKILKKFDFDDMINFILEKFTTDEEFLLSIQEKYQYILVDEFQDTNSSQSELVYKIASYWGEEANIFVVGDDDQSIYRFQGASTENVFDFNNLYPNAEKISLIKNYRSNQEILDLADNLIQKNTVRASDILNIDKKQISMSSQISSAGEQQKNKYIRFHNNFEENMYIVSTIDLLIKDGVKPEEIAIIYRNNYDAKDLVDLLDKFKIQYTIKSPQSVLDDYYIKQIMSIITLIYNLRIGYENIDLFTLLNWDIWKIDSLLILKISRFATEQKIDLFTAINQYTDQGNQDLKNIKSLIKTFIELSKDSNNINFYEFINLLLSKTKYLEFILSQKNSTEILIKLNSFINYFKGYSDNLTLSEYLAALQIVKENNLRIDSNLFTTDSKGINLMTAHSSKGLEFEYVFIPKLLLGHWDTKTVRQLIKLPNNILDTKTITSFDEKQMQLEEARRLLFVAITRAKKYLYLTTSDIYITNGEVAEKMPSLFITELDQKLYQSIDYPDIDVDKMLEYQLRPKSTEIFVEEELLLDKIFKDYKISASDLNKYLKCPYQFKLDKILKPLEPYSRALEFGNLIHKTMEILFTKLKDGNSITIYQSLDIFNSNVEKSKIDEVEKNELKTQGELILTEYFNQYIDEYNQIKPEQILYLEKWFGNGWFAPLIDGYIPLQGKIDRITRDHNSQIVITDYKTGTPKSLNEILGKTKNSTMDELRQLIFYKMIVEYTLNLKLKIDILEVDFIGKKGNKPVKRSVVPSTEQQEQVKSEIINTFNNIKNYNFNRTEEYKHCYDCRYKDHCWPQGIPNTKYENTNTT